MEYPVQLSFKILALASQIYIRDKNGTMQGYVKQKMFKLREKVEVFTDDSRDVPLATIGADRILDFRAAYRIENAAGEKMGVVKRKGMRSFWKAHYDIDGGECVESIREKNAWVKVLDGLLGEIPVLGFFMGYLLNPTYLVLDANEEVVFTVKKRPALFEGRFEIEKEKEISPQEESLALMSVMMMLLLERSRG